MKCQLINSLIVFFSFLVIFAVSSIFAPPVEADHRPDCFRSQSDFKLGVYQERLGFAASHSCTGVMQYMSIAGFMQYFYWGKSTWMGSSYLGGGGDFDVSTHDYRMRTGRGPIPPYFGINCRRVRVHFTTIWFDFSIPDAHPGEGLRSLNRVTRGECW